MKTILDTAAYLAALALFTVVACPQDTLRKIDETSHKYKNTPISVTYELGNQPFAGRNGTLANSEWIRDLALNLTNISEKSITSVTLHLLIEKQGSMEYRAAIPVRFPSVAEPVLDASGKPTGQYRKQIIKPGQSLKVRPLPAALRILDLLKTRDGITDIASISLDIRYINFEDGTSWQIGIDMIPDPSRPGRSIRKTPTVH